MGTLEEGGKGPKRPRESEKNPENKKKLESKTSPSFSPPAAHQRRVEALVRLRESPLGQRVRLGLEL